MDDYHFETVWPRASEMIRREVIDFWLAEDAMPAGVAHQRAGQLVVVVRHAATRRVAAVSTAMVQYVEPPRLRCFFFRAYVGKGHRCKGLRGSDVIQRLVRRSYDVLNQRFQQGLDQGAVGLYLEIQNDSILRHRRELVWRDLGACICFLGVLPSGSHARVRYFEGACLPGPNDVG